MAVAFPTPGRRYVTTKVPLPSQRAKQPNLPTLAPKPDPVPMQAKAPPRAKAPAHEYPAWEADSSYGRTSDAPIDPSELHLHLDVAPYVRLVKFNNEKHLMRYPALLYKVNIEGRFRYATRREGWPSLIILRLK